MDETNDAGGALAQAPAAGQNEVSQSSQQNAGVQARIDELTHYRRTAEADAAATRQLLAAQQAEVQRLQEMLATPPKQEQQVDYSQLGEAGPVVQKAIEDAVRRTTEQLSTRFEAQYKSLQTVQVQSQVASIAAQYGLSPEVSAHAQSVMAGATQRGVPMIPEDAVKWALGEAMMQGKVQPQQIRKPGTNGGVLIGAPPIPSGPVAQRSIAMPANFESASPDQQHAWLVKNGLDDIPLD